MEWNRCWTSYYSPPQKTRVLSSIATAHNLARTVLPVLSHARRFAPIHPAQMICVQTETFTTRTA
ncbi:hypothetical protein JYU34_015218 [Plutella xylostella]|uniref:Uncharacterized protein n=1 Tax=Plutella xylostella TaxID=51655 RepID=A0ABQ7Q6M3_PLUXY|nr:hypothetical protein JYU34_015218 [Plutella xylostella]